MLKNIHSVVKKNTQTIFILYIRSSAPTKQLPLLSLINIYNHYLIFCFYLAGFLEHTLKEEIHE